MAIAPHWPPPLGQSRAGGARARDEETVYTPSTQHGGDVAPHPEAQVSSARAAQNPEGAVTV